MSLNKCWQKKILKMLLDETQAIIEAAKSGDLSNRVPLEGKTGAIASLCDGVNALMDKMTEVIVQVREAGETINTAASEIATVVTMIYLAELNSKLHRCNKRLPAWAVYQAL